MANRINNTTRQFGGAMIAAGWIVILGLLTMYFSGWMDERNNPNQSVAGKVYDDGLREVVLKQNFNGHYVATGRINGHEVQYLLDTGATEVSIPQVLAEKLGLRKGAKRRMTTANGSITTYSTWLDLVELGPIELPKVRAHINPHMSGNEVLLGMSFLRHLELVQRNGRLTIRQP